MKHIEKKERNSKTIINSSVMHQQFNAETERCYGKATHHEKKISQTISRIYSKLNERIQRKDKE